MRGFTLVELLLVMAIVALVGALSVPMLQTTQVSADLTSSTQKLISTLRRAQWQATTEQEADSWGVYFDNGVKSFILFKGVNYAGRDQTADQVFSWPATFTLSTDFGNEIIFNLASGQPTASGTVELTSGNNQTKAILINSYGKIQPGN